MRLIDADALHFNRIRIAHEDGTVGGYNAVVMSAEIKDAPTIDPVKHGKWIEPTREGCLTYDKAAYAECSECGKKEYLGWGKNYCPHCGAKMQRSEE